jgi:hypothetical protein
LRDAESILTIGFLLERSFIRPRLPLSKSTWPPGRRLVLIGPLGTPSLRIRLSKPLGLSDVIWTYLGRTTPPSCGTSSPPCIS